MPQVFLFYPCQRTIFIDRIEKIEQRGGERIIVVQSAKPGHRLFIRDIQRHGQFGMDALKQTDRH